MEQFKSLSKELITMLDGSTRQASTFTDMVSSFTATIFKNPSGAPAEWESSIFFQLCYENIRLVLDK